MVVVKRVRSSGSLVSALLVLTSCMGSGVATTDGSGVDAGDAARSGQTANDSRADTTRPDPWSRRPQEASECPWAGLRFSVDDFVEAPASYDTRDGWYCMNYSGCEWDFEPGAAAGSVAVVEHTGRPGAPPPVPLPLGREFGGPRLDLRVSDGWIISVNRGEFGGGLWWFSPEGDRHERIGERLNVDELLVVDGRPHVVTSLRHMGISEGAIFRLEQVEGAWALIEVAVLPLGPAAVVPGTSPELVIVDDVGLLQVDVRSGAMARIYQSTWHGVGIVRAAAVGDDTILLGGRHSIVRVLRTEDGFVETLMVPPACTSFEVDWDENECRCGDTAQGGAEAP